MEGSFKMMVSVHLFEVVFVFEVVSMFDDVFILAEDDLLRLTVFHSAWK